MKRKSSHTLLPAALLCLLAATTAHPRNQSEPPATLPATDETTQTSQRPEEEIFVCTEKMPTFQGGDLTAFLAWMNTRIEYPVEALERGAEGKVVAGFVVEKDGTVSHVEILASPDPALAQIVQRTIAASPLWKPGETQGRPARVRFIVPFRFQIADTAPEPDAEQLAEPPQGQPAHGQPATNPDRTRHSDTAPQQSVHGQPPVPVSAQTNFSGPNDRLPLFRGGGLDKFREWFSSRLRYPVGAVSQSIEGRALATFVIERDGSMGEITLLEASDSMFGETVVRLLEKSPKWEPGYLSGEPVRVQFTLPVLFRLSTQREPEPMRSPEWQSRWSCSPGASHRF